MHLVFNGSELDLHGLCITKADFKLLAQVEAKPKSLVLSPMLGLQVSGMPLG